jgi:hypothetical protein
MLLTLNSTVLLTTKRHLDIGALVVGQFRSELIPVSQGLKHIWERGLCGDQGTKRGTGIRGQFLVGEHPVRSTSERRSMSHVYEPEESEAEYTWKKERDF